jgi:hypothetical protein
VHYLPSKKIVLLLQIGADGTAGGAYSFDPQTNQGWIAMKVSGSGPKTYDSVSCYDQKHDRVWVKNHYYDVKTSTWTVVPVKGASPTAQDTTEACLNYDSANDCLVHVVFGNAYNPTGIKLGTCVFDPKSNTWSEHPLPVSGGCWNGFYSPELNAHFFHTAGDSADNGTIWVYRYKNVKGK